MDFLQLTFYSVFFVTAVFFTFTSLFYSHRLSNSNFKMGFATPKLLQKVLGISTIFSLIGALLIGYGIVEILATI